MDKDGEKREGGVGEKRERGVGEKVMKSVLQDNKNASLLNLRVQE